MGLTSLLVTVAAAGFVGGLGIAIKYFGRVELIAGYDPDRVTDEEGMAAFVGTNVLYVAGALGVVAVLDYVEPAGGDAAAVAWLVFLIGTVLLTGRMVVGARRYENGAETGGGR
ncbi:hypothetical protein [Halobiforma nitratireducens]|uniref:DUF3784 domain-containing protein n=1 Tax=Halobiforma nitratireducens JCM 10879 TaxID=1227454 RepID=M0LHB4_9EURY|nr:hypothetical protein [Halobiforma nitratireducens]EMA31390.1 hypothetical protein C446_15523 [Halobiforma nitratireducens JCM 10879]